MGIKMNIYLVERIDMEYDWYDTFDSFVCVAENEKDAKQIHPTGNSFFDKGNFGWVDDINNIKVSLVGVSEIKEEKVILSSFNAA